MHPHDQPSLLLVDDQTQSAEVLCASLSQDYHLHVTSLGAQAFAQVTHNPPDLVLIKTRLPDMTGLALCQQLRDTPATCNLPVLFLVPAGEAWDTEAAFAAGAVDELILPISPALLRARIKSHLAVTQLATLTADHLELIQRLGYAFEFKDQHTGLHVMRMSHVSGRIALAMGLGEKFAQQLIAASPLHDIGKVGIPDAILLKPARLTPAEISVMRQHPEIGAQVLANTQSKLLQLAHSIALYHHEKWDGSGYPNGLRGLHIPIEARIVAVADVFDALVNQREYKPAWSVAEAVAEIEAQRGKHFDPAVVDALMACLPDVLAINAKWQEGGWQASDLKMMA